MIDEHKVHKGTVPVLCKFQITTFKTLTILDKKTSNAWATSDGVASAKDLMVRRVLNLPSPDAIMLSNDSTILSLFEQLPR